MPPLASALNEASARERQRHCRSVRAARRYVRNGPHRSSPISHHPSLRRALAGGGDPQDIDGGCYLSVIDELRSDRQACAHSSFSLSSPSPLLSSVLCPPPENLNLGPAAAAPLPSTPVPSDPVLCLCRHLLRVAVNSTSTSTSTLLSSSPLSLSLPPSLAYTIPHPAMCA